MDATTTGQIAELVKQIEADHPGLILCAGQTFSWSPTTQTISYKAPPDEPSTALLLLHELAHAKLQHTSYVLDIDLIKKERDAWTFAHTTLCPVYGVIPDKNLSEDSLESYRQWIHARSTCPSCDSVGIQQAAETYYCPACNTSWHVNEAKQCQLRRTKKHPK